MNEPEPAPAEYHDQSTGLTVCGILTIVIGAFCAIAAGLSALSTALVKNDPALGEIRGVGFIVLFYLILATMFIWLGIGSIQARRWARALLLIIFWGWLAMGVISVGSMFFTFPQMMEMSRSSGANLSPAASRIIMLVTVGFAAVIFVVIPGIGVIFYSGKNVKATCEHKDPVVRWTDRCPLPVLAVSLWMALGVAGMLIAAVAGMAVIPFFGSFVAGLPAVALCVAIAAIWAWAAWAIFRLDERGLWVAIAFTVLFSVSSILTYSRHELSEMYRLAGYSATQVALMEKTPLPRWMMTWGTLVWTIPAVGYLLYTRRYFRKTALPEPKIG